MVEARRVDRLLRCHAVVDDVHDGLEDGGDDARAAGAAKHQNDLAVPLDEGRAHRRQRPLAGGDRVGLALDETAWLKALKAKHDKNALRT